MKTMLFILVLTVFQQGQGPVTTKSEPMTLEACHEKMTAAMTAAGATLMSAHCDPVEVTR